MQYKYVRLNGEGEVIEWAPGENLDVDFNLPMDNGAVVMHDRWGHQREKSKAKIPPKPQKLDLTVSNSC